MQGAPEAAELQENAAEPAAAFQAEPGGASGASGASGANLNIYVHGLFCLKTCQFEGDREVGAGTLQCVLGPPRPKSEKVHQNGLSRTFRGAPKAQHPLQHFFAKNARFVSTNLSPKSVANRGALSVVKI